MSCVQAVVLMMDSPLVSSTTTTTATVVSPTAVSIQYSSSYCSGVVARGILPAVSIL